MEIYLFIKYWLQKIWHTAAYWALTLWKDTMLIYHLAIWVWKLEEKLVISTWPLFADIILEIKGEIVISLTLLDSFIQVIVDYTEYWSSVQKHFSFHIIYTTKTMSFLGSNDEGNVDTAERRQTRTTDDFWKRKRSWQRNQQQMF
jgi:hypothetical protein